MKMYNDKEANLFQYIYLKYLVLTIKKFQKFHHPKIERNWYYQWFQWAFLTLKASLVERECKS